MRSAFLVLLAAPFLSPADYTKCTRFDNGPIIKRAPPIPFVRKPDFAAMTEYPRTLSFDGMPPLRFRAPRRMKVETGAVANNCGTAPRGYVTEACASKTTVYLPNPCDYGEEEFARLFCHEQAHVEGWPEDHGP